MKSRDDCAWGIDDEEDQSGGECLKNGEVNGGEFAPGGEVSFDPSYPVPASSRPDVGGGQPLPYELANFRGQYDSGPGSQFQAGPENNPFVYIPLGPKISFEEALAAIQKYVQWQESQ